jgi:hypothetical protein
MKGDQRIALKSAAQAVIAARAAHQGADIVQILLRHVRGRIDQRDLFRFREPALKRDGHGQILADFRSGAFPGWRLDADRIQPASGSPSSISDSARLFKRSARHWRRRAPAESGCARFPGGRIAPARRPAR